MSIYNQFFTSNAAHHKNLFWLALPMILSNITVPLLGLVDTAVIGHLSHAYYLGGSTVGAMIITSVIWLCGFLRMSTTGLSAQALGKKNIENNLLVLFRGIVVAFGIGLFFIVIKVPFIDTALSLAGGSENVQFYARQYSEIRMWGLPAALANLVVLGWLIGNHQAKKVMWILIATNLTNVLLDLLFVFVFNWQVQGVALATLIAEYSGLSLGLFIVFCHYKEAIKKLIRNSKNFLTNLFEKQNLLGYFKLNRDILIRTLCLEICFIFITFQGARLGDEIIAANAILMNFLLLISFGLDGIANATEAMVGKSAGENNHVELHKVVNIALFWSVVFSMCYVVLFFVAGEGILRLISSIENVVMTAKIYLPWLILLPIISCWCYLFDGVYIGLMKAKVMRNSMIISTFACFFPVWFLFDSMLPISSGNHALWAAFSVFMLVRGLTLGWHFYIMEKVKS